MSNLHPCLSFSRRSFPPQYSLILLSLPTDIAKRLLKSSTTQEIIFATWLILFLVFCYVFTFYGIFSLLKMKEYFSLFLFLGLIFYFTFLTGIGGSPRLKIPVVPFYSMLAAYGFVKLLKLKFQKKFFK